MEDLNYSLFDEEAFKDIPRSQSAGLTIRKGSRKSFSKAQREFNRLTKRIAELQRQLEERRVHYDEILNAWAGQMPQLDAAYAERQLRIALQLDKAGTRFKFGSVQILRLQFAIMTLIREAFNVIDPTPEGEAVFQRWNGKELGKVMQEEFDIIKSVMQEELRNSLGMDMDLSDIDMSEEGFARFSAQFQAQIADAEWQDAKPGYRTARELQAEMRAKLDAERVKRGIRAVYLNIAKALHPDTTLDEAERLRRDDVMKTVTVAYENHDMQTLLRIEMIEMERGADRINQLPDETLALYNASLKGQMEELQMELHDLRLHPRYMPISSILARNPAYANTNLQREIQETKRLIEHYEQTLTVLSDNAPKQDVVAFLEKLCKDYDEEFAIWSGRPLERPVYDFRSYWESRF